jgi:hypothetical protein
VGQDGKENDKEIHGTDDRALLKIRAAPVWRNLPEVDASGEE